MPKEDNEDFKHSTKFWICNNDYVDNDVKVRDHCHITGKYRDPAQKIPVLFHNVKDYDTHLIIKELDKFNL